MIDLEQLYNVEGRTAVITGGTRGIGLEMAKALTAQGATVIISSRKDEAVKAATADLSHLGSAFGFAADLGTVEGAKALAAFVEDKADQVDILINNAGASWGSTLADFPEAGWDKVMDVNLKGPFFLTQAMLNLLTRAGSPDRPAKIINIASVEGMRPGPLETYSYGTSKAGLIYLTKHLASQLAPRHITANAIAPGPFMTKMLQGTADMVGEDTLVNMVPLKRLGRPEDLHALALFLSSPASDYITGQTVALGGGLGTIA